MGKMRKETDSFGAINVPQKALWGAQTQRSLGNFAIGEERMPNALIRSLGMVKFAAAKTNMKLKTLSKRKGDAICKAASEVMEGKLNAHFPLSVWQTGSGTQSNMNANEVIANRAIQILGGKIGSKKPVHPNDDCNQSQSSNDSFPSAIHIAAVEQISHRLLPALERLEKELGKKEKAWRIIVKIGRTHLQDATPLTLGQEFSGYRAQLQSNIKRIKKALPSLLALAQGGTAIGTGINSKKGFAKQFASEVAKISKLPFTSAPNKFEALAGHDACVEMAGMLSTLSASLFKIANDIRLLGSGPRSGLGELLLPENEPGSSIMPGKVNPTQCEAMTMICVQVLGNSQTITFAGTQGHLELNVFKPVIAYNLLQSIGLLADGMDSFCKNCVKGIKPNKKRIQAQLEQSLMLVTALAPHIGYDKASEIAKSAHKNGTSLREEAMKMGAVSAADFDKIVRPKNMTTPNK